MPRTVVFACLLALLALPPAAQAQDTRSKIFRECQDGALRGDYTSKQIRDARNNIPDDIDQYSDCRDVLSRALTSRAGGGSGAGGADAGGGFGAGGFGAGGGGAGGGAGELLTPSTDADRAALAEAAASGDAPVEVGGETVVPGAAGLATGAARNALPDTLIVLLALLALAAVAGLAPLARRRAAGSAAVLGPVLRRVLPGGSR